MQEIYFLACVYENKNTFLKKDFNFFAKLKIMLVFYRK